MALIHLWLVTRSSCWPRPSPMWTPVSPWVAAPGACEVGQQMMSCQQISQIKHFQLLRVKYFQITKLNWVTNVPECVQNSSEIHLNSRSFHPMSPRVFQKKEGWCRAERTAAVLSRNEKLLLAARMKHGRCVCPKALNRFTDGTDGFTMDQYGSIWYRWFLHAVLERAEFHGFGTCWFGCTWRIADAICDEYSVPPNSMERWKPYRSTQCSHTLSLDKFPQMFPQSGLGFLTWKVLVTSHTSF